MWSNRLHCLVLRKITRSMAFSDTCICLINTLRPRRNGQHFADDMFKCIFLNENVWIPIDISLKFVPKGSINNTPTLFQIMAWCRPGDKPLSEPMMVSSLTHICVTRPQWLYGICRRKIQTFLESGVFYQGSFWVRARPVRESVARRHAFARNTG